MNSLNSLLNAVPMPMLAIDVDQNVFDMNMPMKGLLGSYIIGRHYIAALRQPRLLNAIELVFHDGETRTSRYLLRDGSSDIAYDVQISRVDGGVLLAFQDRSATDEAIQARRAFVANVSHELRTPLTALSGFIETLQGAARDDAETRARFLDIMQREARRMTQLVDDLLSLSRVEQNRRVRPTDVVDLARQVIVNLLENALKYGGGTGIGVTLTGPSHITSLQELGVRLSVSDKGAGIASHHLPRLTERFYRVDNHRSRDVGGTGLGLAIVKHIVQRHHGKLDISSVVGTGTTVSISLPMATTRAD